MVNSNQKLDLIKNNLNDIKNPIILELGVNRGGSTKFFLKHIEENNGKLFSIDIKDCSSVSDSKNWNFLISDDLDYNFIVSKFKEISEKGIDVLFIDSYHDPSHVKILLEKWSFLVNINGVIILDDTESLPYKLKKNFIFSVINDAVDDVVKNFYYSNHDQYEYTKFYKGAGLSLLEKKSLKETSINKKRIWDYNVIFSKIYLFLKKTLFLFRNFKKR